MYIVALRGPKSNTLKNMEKKDYNNIHNLLITLTHAERRNITLEEAMKRFTSKYPMEKGIGCQESHKDGGYHYHLGFKTVIPRRKSIPSIRRMYPEFDGRSIDIKAHKSFDSVVIYTEKEKNSTKILYNMNTQEINEIKMRRGKKLSSLEVVERLKGLKSWDDALDDPLLSRKLVTNWSSMYQLFVAFQQRERRGHNKWERTLKRLKKYESYDMIDLKTFGDFGLALCWMAQNLSSERRKHKQQQLYILGKSDIGKSYFILALQESKGLSIYTLPHRKGDLTGYADGLYNLIVIDEYKSEPLESSGFLKLLSGEPLGFDRKYQTIDFKKENPGVVLLGTRPRGYLKDGSADRSFNIKSELVNRVYALPVTEGMPKEDLNLLSKRMMKTLHVLCTEYEIYLYGRFLDHPDGSGYKILERVKLIHKESNSEQILTLSDAFREDVDLLKLDGSNKLKYKSIIEQEQLQEQREKLKEKIIETWYPAMIDQLEALPAAIHRDLEQHFSRGVLDTAGRAFKKYYNETLSRKNYTSSPLDIKLTEDEANYFEPNSPQAIGLIIIKLSIELRGLKDKLYEYWFYVKEKGEKARIIEAENEMKEKLLHYAKQHSWFSRKFNKIRNAKSKEIAQKTKTD